MTEIDFLLGRSIAAQRRKRGLSRDTLAGKLALSADTIAAFEEGTRRATAQQLFEIADILEVQIVGLFSQADAAVEDAPLRTPLEPETEGLVGFYGALSKAHRTAIFAFLLATGRDRGEDPTCSS